MDPAKIALLCESEWDFANAKTLYSACDTHVYLIQWNGDCSDWQAETNQWYVIKQVKVSRMDQFESTTREWNILNNINDKTEHSGIATLRTILRRRHSSTNPFWCYCFVFNDLPNHKPLLHYCLQDTTLAEYYSDRLNEEEIKSIVKQLVRTLVFLQSKNYIHGDIKPANILYNRTTGKMKLIDFGASFEIGTAKSELVSTHEYLPYEVAFYDLSCLQDDSKIDVWSLGVTIVEMYCGKIIRQLIVRERPFVFRRFISLNEFLKHHPVEFFRHHNEQIQNPYAQSFVKRCLQFLPHQRANLEELLKHPYLK